MKYKQKKVANIVLHSVLSSWSFFNLIIWKTSFKALTFKINHLKTRIKLKNKPFMRFRVNREWHIVNNLICFCRLKYSFSKSNLLIFLVRFLNEINLESGLTFKLDVFQQQIKDKTNVKDKCCGTLLLLRYLEFYF